MNRYFNEFILFFHSHGGSMKKTIVPALFALILMVSGCGKKTTSTTEVADFLTGTYSGTDYDLLADSVEDFSMCLQNNGTEYVIRNGANFGATANQMVLYVLKVKSAKMITRPYSDCDIGLTFSSIASALTSDSFPTGNWILTTDECSKVTIENGKLKFANVAISLQPATAKNVSTAVLNGSITVTDTGTCPVLE